MQRHRLPAAIKRFATCEADSTMRANVAPANRARHHDCHDTQRRRSVNIIFGNRQDGLSPRPEFGAAARRA
jgi:hypothetical protein